MENELTPNGFYPFKMVLNEGVWEWLLLTGNVPLLFVLFLTSLKDTLENKRCIAVFLKQHSEEEMNTSSHFLLTVKQCPCQHEMKTWWRVILYMKDTPASGTYRYVVVWYYMWPVMNTELTHRLKIVKEKTIVCDNCGALEDSVPWQWKPVGCVQIIYV